MNRRSFVRSVVAASLLPGLPAAVSAKELPKIIVHRDPSCGCCGAWVAHMRNAGFTADVLESRNMQEVKARLGLPGELASCHTGEVAGYVIEGHVPADAVKRLLAERPDAKGLAVPGMPIGSPGMEVPGQPDDTYDVVIFGPAGQSVFARYRGGVRVMT